LPAARLGASLPLGSGGRGGCSRALDNRNLIHFSGGAQSAGGDLGIQWTQLQGRCPAAAIADAEALGAQRSCYGHRSSESLAV